MFLEDARRTHLAAPDFVLELYHSTNQPLVQPAGRVAEPATAVVAALARPEGAVEVVVALTLAESGRNVVYAGARGLTEAEVPAAVEEAMVFAESMGFMLEDTGWRGLSGQQRSELVDRLPAFGPPRARREEKPVQRVKTQDPLAAVARLFAAFAVLVAALSTGCTGPSHEQRERAGEIHYDLGTSLLSEGNTQGALSEYLQAEESDPELPQVHNALGLLYGFSLARPQDAEKQFQRALELRPDYPEASTNYGALLLSQNRFKEAIPHFEKALANPLYTSRAVAETNLGWALYKSGQQEKGIGRIKGALLVAPKYCLGWKQLGIIYSEQNKLEDANDALSKYAASCPETADAWLQSGKALARLSRADDARNAFQRCIEVGAQKPSPAASECTRLLRELGTP